MFRNDIQTLKFNWGERDPFRGWRHLICISRMRSFQSLHFYTFSIIISLTVNITTFQPLCPLDFNNFELNSSFNPWGYILSFGWTCLGISPLDLLIYFSSCFRWFQIQLPGPETELITTLSPNSEVNGLSLSEELWVLNLMHLLMSTASLVTHD